MKYLLHKLMIIALLVTMPLGFVSCAAIIPALPAIASVVTDALVIMNIIDGAVTDFFRQHPTNTERAQKKYRELFAKAMYALNAAQHAVEGEKNISQENYDAAFREFKQAFLDLKTLLESEGLMQGGFLKAGQTEVLIPEPEALTYKVR